MIKASETRPLEPGTWYLELMTYPITKRSKLKRLAERGHYDEASVFAVLDAGLVAHVAIAEAARDRFELDRVDLAVSRVALAKAARAEPSFEQRIEVLESLGARLGWLGVVVSERQLIVELAEGYDVVIMGADKWVQVHDPDFYGGSTSERDAAVARLPAVALAPRPPHEVPAELQLEVPRSMWDVSSTLARGGRREYTQDCA